MELTGTRNTTVDGSGGAAGLTVADARAALAAQPFSVLLGARLVCFGAGSAVLEVPWRDDLRQQNGFLHGGVLAYAADNCMTFAGGSVLGAVVLTGGLTISYLRPARRGTLRAVATVLHSTRRQALCRCELSMVDGDVQLCAAAQGTVVVAGAPGPAGPPAGQDPPDSTADTVARSVSDMPPLRRNAC